MLGQWVAQQGLRADEAVALDGKTLDKPGIVTDDGLIGETRIKKLWTNQKK